jgi:spore coat polysaccharide biosynthesis predicted glycosyltransferase SpsG
MSLPAVIMITSNGVGAGHLIRSSAIARKLQKNARPIILSMAYSVVEVASALGFECEFIPGKDKGLMPNRYWDRYLRDRILALIEETGARVVTLDGVVPYPGFLSAKFVRPDVTFIWIRRGMWQKQPQGVALSIQSSLVDKVIEPGDLAREYDFGPTKNRREAILTRPVSLYESEQSLSRNTARELLGLPREKPAVLVQMGVGAKDLDDRVSAVLKGLSRWREIQIVMAKEPRNFRGESLIPNGIEVKVIRHFPLAEVIHAFDAVVCAAGYNSVHEVIPAAIPSLLIANNRGTDDQFARARWCQEKKLTLYADSESLSEIQEKSIALTDALTRTNLSRECAHIGDLNGASEIAEIILSSISTPRKNDAIHLLRRRGTMLRGFIQRGASFLLKRTIYNLLWGASLIYRKIFPHKHDPLNHGNILVSRSSDHVFLEKYIKGTYRLEQILLNSSSQYESRRIEIAKRAFRLSKNVEVQEI